MNTNNFSHKNGFNKPSNFYNSSSGSQCDLSDALNSQLFNDDVAFEKTVHCSSNARISGPTREPPAKRFKPNPTGSRMRISFDGSEEAFKTHTTPLATHDSCPPGTCQCPLSPEPLSTSIGSVSRTPSTDSQYSRERPSYVPAGDTKQNNIGKEGSSGVESDCGCVGRKERTFSGSTVTSPSLTSTTPNGTGLTRDLSLGREDSVDSADNSSRLPEEAKEPERSKDCRCGEIRVGKVVGTGEDESDKLSGTGRKSVSNPKIRAKLAHKAAHSGCKAEEAISDLGTDDSLLQTLKRAAAEQGFECLSTKCPSEDSPLTYRCPENHIISTKDFPRTRMLSCPKCQKRLDRCMAYAKAHKGIHRDFPLPNSIGKVLNKTFNEYIEYECEQGHVWKIKYSE